VEDSNELVTRLSTAAGIIMEDSSPVAISLLPTAPDELEARLAELEQAMLDATILLQAARVLARRNIR
jgi:hypothetical protein